MTGPGLSPVHPDTVGALDPDALPPQRGRSLRGAALAAAARALGPVFVKACQVLSTREELFSPEVARSLARLRDALPAEQRRYIIRTVDAALGRDHREVFASFDFPPIGCGSVAQVHAATLHDGQAVAVKVLRPDIERRVGRSLRRLRTLCTVASRALAVTGRSFDMNPTLDSVQDFLLSQVDLDHERQNIHRFREAVARQGFRIKNEDLIKVPEPVDELSSRTMLVMEYVSGVHPERYASLPVPPARLADTLDDLEDLMVNFNGLVHGDLHPGNFYWTREGRVVLVDFGLVVEMDKVDVESLLSFYMGLVEGFDDYAVHIFLERLTEAPARDILSREEYGRLFREMHRILVADGIVGTGGRPRFYEMTVRFQQALHRFELRAKDSYIRVFLALISIEGYIYGLSPTFNMLENARRKRLEAAEYVDIPQDVLEPALGAATYSTAVSEFAADVEGFETAFVRTRRFIGEQLAVKPGDKVLDVGCGRGHLLTDLSEDFGAVPYGITLSGVESAACRDRGVEHVLHGSWERSEPFLIEHGPFDHMAIVEMDCHMATLEENQNGFLEVKLDQLFAQSHRHLVPGGTIFFQQLDIDDAVFADRALFTEIVETIPFMGFSRREQVDKAAKPYFELERNLVGTRRDLTMTYEFLLHRFEQHSAHFLAHMDKRLHEMIMREIRLTLRLAENDLLRVNRFVLKARPEPDFSLSENLLSKFEIPRPQPSH